MCISKKSNFVTEFDSNMTFIIGQNVTTQMTFYKKYYIPNVNEYQNTSLVTLKHSS